MSHTNRHTRPRRWIRGLGLLAAVPVIMGLAVGCTRFGATVARPEEPVVMDGSSLPKLLGTAPQHVVAFSWDGKQWVQIPVQVDQRDWVNPGQILNRPASGYAKLPGGADYKVLVYTNPAAAGPGYSWSPTYTGVAGHSGLGADDEVSFLSNDSGQLAPAGTASPAGVDAASLEQVKVNDSLVANNFGYVYLFSSATLSGGGAGTDGVHYTFGLDSGTYQSTYHMGASANPPNNSILPNPEHSSVVTPSYSLTFGDRWLNNGLAMTTQGATGANILERGRVQLVPSTCGRSEDTFDNVIPSSPYEAGFIVNLSGPVRAIRSSMGANSGQYTVTTDVFYPQRQDSTVDLRVHVIPGAMVFNDFATGVTGLRYSDSNTTAGVPVDGGPDSVASTPASWQMVSGPQGSLVTTQSLTSDIAGLVRSTYYLDQSPATPVPCTGDATAWGQSGAAVVGPGGGNLPCTDPTIYGVPGACPTVAGQATANTLTATAHRYFEVPGFTATQAAALAADTATPLQTTVSSSIG
jgi:hypothetical protein